MLEPTQVYFAVAVLSFLIGLTAVFALRFRKLWIMISCVLLCILLACTSAIFLLNFTEPDGSATPEFWANLIELATFIILPVGLGLVLLELIELIVELIVPKRAQPPR